MRPPSRDIDTALRALEGADLRGVVRDLLTRLDERDMARAELALIDLAARRGSGWVPEASSDKEVERAMDFARAAVEAGFATAADVDTCLQCASRAFLRRQYDVAFRLFDLLLQPLDRGEIDIGHGETVDELLGSNLMDCAAQYVVSTYIIATAAERPEAVRTAIASAGGTGYFWKPIKEMHRVALEPLPGLPHFLRGWRALVERLPVDARADGRDTDRERWLREAVFHLEGSAGLGRMARLSKRASDLGAWCECLVDAGDWNAAFSAYEEAAELVRGQEFEWARMLDGCALAAQESGRDDLEVWLDRAWRPNRRWRGCSAGSGRRAARRHCWSAPHGHLKSARNARPDSGRCCCCSRARSSPPRASWRKPRVLAGRPQSIPDSCCFRCSPRSSGTTPNWRPRLPGGRTRRARRWIIPIR